MNGTQLIRLWIRAYYRFNRSGAHYVIGSVAGLIPVLEEIEMRLVAGEKQ